jgi:hypothetical protein
LELTFAADVNLASQVGRTFRGFDWTDVNPTGAFTVHSPFAWDLANLYTTSEVMLTAIPEPEVAVLFRLSILTFFFFPHRPRAAKKVAESLSRFDMVDIVRCRKCAQLPGVSTCQHEKHGQPRIA